MPVIASFALLYICCKSTKGSLGLTVYVCANNQQVTVCVAVCFKYCSQRLLPGLARIPRRRHRHRLPREDPRRHVRRAIEVIPVASWTTRRHFATRRGMQDLLRLACNAIWYILRETASRGPSALADILVIQQVDISNNKQISPRSRRKHTYIRYF